MVDSDTLAMATVRSLFPLGVFTEVEVGSQDVPPLFPEEEQYVARAVPKRQREFALGRACARRAMRAMGIAPTAVLRMPSGVPAWPQDVLGSITHCDGLVAAAMCHAGPLCAIGIDAEERTVLEADLVPLICTETEIEWMARVPSIDGADAGKLIFSAKETVHKCLYPLIGATLDFLEVELTILPAEGRFAVQRCTRLNSEFDILGGFEGRYAVTDTHLLTGGVIRKGLVSATTNEQIPTW